MICKKCGAYNDQMYTYCIFCGAKLSENEEHTQEKIEQKAEVTVTESKLHKVFGIVGGAVGILGVCLSLVFSFFIGVVTDSEPFAPLVGYTDGLGIQETGILDFFWSVFIHISHLGLNIPEGDYQWQLRAAWISYGFIGMAISAWIIISVIVFSVFAVIKYIRSFFGGSRQEADKWCILTMLMFIVGVCIFYGMNRAAVSTSPTMRDRSARYSLNAETLTGLILSCVCLGLFLLIRIFCLGRKSFEIKELRKNIPALVGVVLTIVIFSLGTTGVGLFLNGAYNDTPIQASFGYGVLPVTILSVFGKNEEFLQIFPVNSADGFLFSCSFSQIALTVVLVCTAFSVTANLRTMMGGKASSGLIWAIVAMLMTAVLVLFTYCGVDRIMELNGDYIRGQEKPSVGGFPVSCVLFGLVFLNFVCQIVQACILNKYRGKKNKLRNLMPRKSSVREL